MLFDIRTIVGALLGLYGIILVVTGLVQDTAEAHAKTGGIDVNLWTGLAMVAVAAAFLLWVRLRPVATDRPGQATPDRPDSAVDTEEDDRHGPRNRQGS